MKWKIEREMEKKLVIRGFSKKGILEEFDLTPLEYNRILSTVFIHLYYHDYRTIIRLRKEELNEILGRNQEKLWLVTSSGTRIYLEFSPSPYSRSSSYIAIDVI